MRALAAVVAGCGLLLTGCSGSAPTPPAASLSGPGAATPTASAPVLAPTPVLTPTPVLAPSSPGSLNPAGASPSPGPATPTRTAAPRPTSAAAVRPSATASTAVRTTAPAVRTPTPSGTVVRTPAPTPGADCPLTPAPVRMVDDAFTPAAVRIGVGTAITMTNCGAKFHTWTSPAAGFDSGAMAVRATFRFAFTTAGTFTFLCSYHPGMRGSVTVD